MRESHKGENEQRLKVCGEWESKRLWESTEDKLSDLGIGGGETLQKRRAAFTAKCVGNVPCNLG